MFKGLRRTVVSAWQRGEGIRKSPNLHDVINGPPLAMLLTYSISLSCVNVYHCRRDLPRATSTSALSSASVFRLLGRVGDTVNKMTYKMEENDPWYEEKLLQIDSLESQLKKLFAIVDSLQGKCH